MNKANRKVWSLSLLVFISGCITTPNIQDLSPDIRAKVGAVIIYKNNIPSESYQRIKTVEGISCHRNAYESRVLTSDEAIDGMRIKAAELDANALTNIVCQQSTGIDWRNNCFQSIVCVGDAVKIINPTAIAQPDQTQTPLPNKTISFGSGFMISPGLVVTNYHVIAGKNNFTIIDEKGKKYNATLSVADKVNDLAILIPDKQQTLPLGLPIAYQMANIGTQIFTIGYPHPSIMGGRPKITDGIISSVSGIQDDPRNYQITVPLQSGNSGGPVLNMNGEVIGVAVAKLNAAYLYQKTGDLPENVNYAVKSQYLRPLIESIQYKGVSIGEKVKKTRSLEELADSIKDSVMIIVAQ